MLLSYIYAVSSNHFIAENPQAQFSVTSRRYITPSRLGEKGAEQLAHVMNNVERHKLVEILAYSVQLAAYQTDRNLTGETVYALQKL